MRTIVIGNLEVYGIIYDIRNKTNNKHYIGQTTAKSGFNGRYHRKGKGIERVYRYHKNLKNRNDNGFNPYLFNSIEKYGFENFEVNEIKDVAFSQYELNIKEQCWINIYDSFGNGYNRNLGGDSHPLSELTKCKISKANIGKLKGGKSPHARKIICITLNKIFDCITEASMFAKKNTSDICSCCKGDIQYSGMVNGNFLVWQYYDDYLNNPKSNIVHTGKVVCLNTKQIFNSQKEAGDYYKMDYYGIGRCCNNKVKSAGKLNGEKLVWVYYEEYITMSQELISKKITENNMTIREYKGREVICITTNIKFNSCKEASIYASRNPCSIIQCCKQNTNSCGKLSDGTPLKWMYYD